MSSSEKPHSNKPSYFTFDGKDLQRGFKDLFLCLHSVSFILIKEAFPEKNFSSCHEWSKILSQLCYTSIEAKVSNLLARNSVNLAPFSQVLIV